jgi:hypothetical protein
MAYKADLPPDLKGHSIDTAHPLYVAFAADAEKRGMSQEAFTASLAAYARGATGKPAPAPAAAPAPAPDAKLDFSKMSTREAFTHAVTARSDRPGRR